MKPEKTLDRRLWGLLIGIVSVAYLALLSSQWVPTVDGTFYLILSRNLATGEGFTFLGQPVRNAPPGWPWLLAGIMQCTASFAVICVVPMVVTTLSVVTWYPVLRRYAAPWKTFWILLVVAFLFHWHRAAYEFISESLFFFLAAATILVALQINEGRSLRWRLPLLIGLCIALVFARWIGLFIAPVVGGAIMNRKPLLAFHRFWVIGLATSVVILGTFVGIREGLKNGDDISTTNIEETATLARVENAVKSTPAVFVSWRKARYQIRLLNAGDWVSRLLFPPAELGRFSRRMQLIDVFWNGVGWILIALLVVSNIGYIRRKEWIWAGVLIYCFTLFARWGSPNGRYLSPIAPLVLLGVWNGFDVVYGIARDGAWGKVLHVTRVGFVVALISTNFAIYGINVWVSRADDYYGRCLAGNTRTLIATGTYLREHSVSGAEIATNDRMRSFGTLKTNRFTCSSLELLTGEVIRVVPQHICAAEPNETLIPWAEEQGVKYYVYRTPEEPWRLWHFHLPWIQEFITGRRPGPVQDGFELYAIDGGEIKRIDLSRSAIRVESIPCL